MAHDNTPPAGEPDPIEGPADLAGTVTIDMFVATGTSSIALSDATATLRLNETKTVTLTITPNGATGTGTLALANAPAGVTATFNPPTVTLGASPVTSTMTVTSLSSMTPVSSAATNVTLTVGTATSTKTFGLTVLPELLLSIANGVVLTNNPTAFGGASIPVKLIGAGTKITFVNMDAKEHRIHADGTGGVAHEGNNMAAAPAVGMPGGTYTQTITATGTIPLRCHVHPGMTVNVVVQ